MPRFPELLLHGDVPGSALLDLHAYPADAVHLGQEDLFHPLIGENIRLALPDQDVADHLPPELLAHERAQEVPVGQGKGPPDTGR